MVRYRQYIQRHILRELCTSCAYVDTHSSITSSDTPAHLFCGTIDCCNTTYLEITSAFYGLLICKGVPLRYSFGGGAAPFFLGPGGPKGRQGVGRGDEQLASDPRRATRWGCLTGATTSTSGLLLIRTYLTLI